MMMALCRYEQLQYDITIQRAKIGSCISCCHVYAIGKRYHSKIYTVYVLVSDV